MFAAQERAELTRELARLYTHTDSIRRIALAIGVQLQYVDMDGNALNVWSSVVEEANHRGFMNRLINIATLEQPESAEFWRLGALYLQDQQATAQLDKVIQGRALHDLEQRMGQREGKKT